MTTTGPRERFPTHLHLYRLNRRPAGAVSRMLGESEPAPVRKAARDCEPRTIEAAAVDAQIDDHSAALPEVAEDHIESGIKRCEIVPEELRDGAPRVWQVIRPTRRIGVREPEQPKHVQVADARLQGAPGQDVVACAHERCACGLEGLEHDVLDARGNRIHGRSRGDAAIGRAEHRLHRRPQIDVPSALMKESRRRDGDMAIVERRQHLAEGREQLGRGRRPAHARTMTPVNVLPVDAVQIEERIVLVEQMPERVEAGHGIVVVARRGQQRHIGKPRNPVEAIASDVTGLVQAECVGTARLNPVITAHEVLM